MADLTVEGGGSVLLLSPQTKRARAWIDEHIGSDNGFQPYYPVIAVEARYLDDILAGAQESGLEIEVS